MLKGIPRSGPVGNMDLDQEGGRDSGIIKGFIITGWQGAYIYVILCRLPGEGLV